MQRFLKWPSKIKAYVLAMVMVSAMANPAVGETFSTLQKKELIVFGIKAMGMDADVTTVKNVLSMPEVEKLVSVGLLLNGHLCARLTEIRSLKIKGGYEVTCIAYRNGKAQKSYIIDALKGAAFLP